MSSGKWHQFRKVLQRKRVFQPEQLDQGNLRRCLNSWDLTGLGLGSTLGVGIYVLVGSVALRVAGPSIVLSFLIAAVTSLFAGLCYAEFGSRVPRTGSAYIYTYVTVGELLAFLIGWNMILESLFGAASVAKGLSLYLDSMAGGAMSRWFTSLMPMSSPLLSPYFDLLSFGLVLVLGVLLGLGARASSSVNNVLALMNMLVIMFVIIAGAFTANVNNWSIPVSAVPEGSGVGGFFPYGVWGTLQGAAICFYGFVGFDVISATGEEVREPRRSIPQAILTVLAIVFLSYAGVAIVITMMVPYYDLDKVAAVATAFTYVGWDWARWVVSIGAVFGIFASLFGSMFPLPRLLYAMASDGLLVHWFSRVSASQSPTVATLLSACVIAVLSATFELDQLILMMAVGTLLSYTIVAACVIVLRYRSKHRPESSPSIIKQLFGCGDRVASRSTSKVAHGSLILFICVCTTTALVGVKIEQPLVPVAALHAVALVLVVIIMLQPQAKEEISFKTPCVPIVPCLSIYVNIHLMILVNVQTWIRVIIWIAIGIPVYIICLLCYKRQKANFEENTGTCTHKGMNGKPPVQIVVESPTPPETLTKISSHASDNEQTSNHDGIADANITEPNKIVKHNIMVIEPYIADEIIVQQAVIENHDEKEAKIIDLLDQVLQDAEDSYSEIITLKDSNNEEINYANTEAIPHIKSLSDLSDAGSDASGQVLAKYDVIAQVHREDLPKLREEEEKIDGEIKNSIIEDNIENSFEKETEDENDTKEREIDDRDITALDDSSETNSRTDESGYSDTLDRNIISDSIEETREEYINIPEPPPLDENYFASPNFKKAHTISSRPTRKQELDLLDEDDNKPRVSVLSNSSQENNNIVFGSERQMSFMSKLNNIFQTKISEGPEEKLKRSNSTGNFADEELTVIRERPKIFMDLKNELKAKHSTPNLRSTRKHSDKVHTHIENNLEDSSVAHQDTSMSREDLKSKLETILANGGPKLLKPRLMKSNPPTPEEAYQTDTSSTESIPKLPKIEKNDTLKRQKDKFSEVLNSFRLSLNKDDVV